MGAAILQSADVYFIVLTRLVMVLTREAVTAAAAIACCVVIAEFISTRHYCLRLLEWREYQWRR